MGFGEVENCLRWIGFWCIHLVTLFSHISPCIIVYIKYQIIRKCMDIVLYSNIPTYYIYIVYIIGYILYNFTSYISFR